MPAIEFTSGVFAKHILIAFFGAFVHALNAQRNGNTKNFLDVITLTIISSFSGVMFFIIGLHFLGEGSYLTIALAGSGGFLGVEGMTIIVSVLKKSVIANFGK
jgi:hypothetical protein